MVVLNKALAEKQKITQEQRDNLANLYDYMGELLTQASEDKDIQKNGKSYAKRMETLEFELQKNWNFPQDKLFHTWWNKFSKCTCPKMDNDERFGFEKIIVTTCPFHGTE